MDRQAKLAGSVDNDPKRTSNSRWREALLLLAVCCYGLCDYGVSPYMAFR